MPKKKKKGAAGRGKKKGGGSGIALTITARLDEWLWKSAEIPGFKTRSKTKKRIKEGCVQVNGRVTLKPAKKLKVLHLCT